MRAYSPFIACSAIAATCWISGAHWLVSLVVGLECFGMHLWGYQNGYDEEHARRKKCVR